MDQVQELDQSGLATPERPATKPSARFRLSLAGLMAIVLAVGIACGLLLRESDRRRREIRMWGEIGRPRETSFLILHSPDPIVRQHASVQPLQWSDQRAGGNAYSGRDWIDSDRIWFVVQGKPHDLVNLAVTGDAKDFDVTPIVIEDRGGELNAHFIDRLTEAYRANHWAYRIVHAARGEGESAPPR